MKLISIVVPVYNVEKYLEQCVESLIKQSYTNIEIILVNDGSRDGSGILCNKLAQRDKRIKVINKENQGLGLARNTGLEYVTGEYVTFIDSDDYADEDLIYNLYKGIEVNNTDTCIGGFKKVDNYGRILFVEKYNEKTYYDAQVRNQLFVRMLGSSPQKSDAMRMSVWNVLYSVDIIKRNNIIFKSEREYISEDIIFNLEYYRYSLAVTVLDTCSYCYRYNNNSLTMKYRVDRFEKYEFLYDFIYEKIKSYSFSKCDIYRLQRQHFVNVRHCIKQERRNISKLERKIAISNIRNICKSEKLQKIVKNYPMEEIGIKQRLFLLMIKNQMYKLLYLCVNIKLI